MCASISAGASSATARSRVAPHRRFVASSLSPSCVRLCQRSCRLDSPSASISSCSIHDKRWSSSMRTETSEESRSSSSRRRTRKASDLSDSSASMAATSSLGSRSASMRRKLAASSSARGATTARGIATGASSVAAGASGASWPRAGDTSKKRAARAKRGSVRRHNTRRGYQPVPRAAIESAWLLAPIG